MVDGLKSGFSVTDFFNAVEQHLKEGKIRIVFFLEQAPDELKRSVVFLIVEARQFEGNGLKVVAPTLFGFTERIREIKKARQSDGERKVVAIDWESFEANAKEKDTNGPAIAAMRNIYDTCKELQADITWGRGKMTGSFGPKWPSIYSGAALFSMFADGRLELHFSSFGKSEKAQAFRKALVERLREGEFRLPDSWENGWPDVYPADWLAKVDVLIAAVRDSVSANLSSAAPV
jgi:hypothetical protein